MRFYPQHPRPFYPAPGLLPASSNVVYIDPTASGAGSGTISDPFQSWSSVTWEAGKSYLQKAGTTYTGAILPTVGGTSDSNRVTIGMYGSGAKPILDGAGSVQNAIFTFGLAYLTIEDLEVTDTTDHGLNICASASGPITGLRINRVFAHHCGSDGIALRSYYLESGIAESSDIVITDCEGSDNAVFGIAAVGHFNGVTYDNCEAHRNGTAAVLGAWGLYAAPANATPSSWSLVSGTVYATTLTGLDASRVVTGVGCSGTATSFLTEAADFAAVGVGEYKQSGAVLRVNFGENPTGQLVVARFFKCANVLITNCEASGNFDREDGGDGSGIGFDHLVEDSEISDCYSHDNEGSGVIAHICDTGIVLARNHTANNGDEGITCIAVDTPTVDQNNAEDGYQFLRARPLVLPTNTFVNSSGWGLNAGWSIASGKLSLNGNAYANYLDGTYFPQGTTFRVEFDYEYTSGDFVYIYLRDDVSPTAIPKTTGPKSFDIVAGAVGSVGFTLAAFSPTIASLDNLSITPL